MTDLNLEGMALADGVVETIVAVALHDIEGITLVGGTTAAALLGQLANVKPAAQSVEVQATGPNALAVGVHIEADFGLVLPDVAATVRSAVVDAIATQVGAEVSAVDVYIDGIRF